MTRDEILNMPAGREMDELIATEVMGWHYDKFISKLYWLTDDEKPVWLRYFYSETPENEFEPSTEIDHAWQVIGKFPVMSLAFRGKYWFCDLSQIDFEYSQAETAPLAICRAALLAVME